MTPGTLAEVLGLPPIPRGTWVGEAVYVSPVALRRGEDPEELAERLRALPGITAVRVRPRGFLEIVVAVPGELVTEIGATVPVPTGEKPVPAREVPVAPGDTSAVPVAEGGVPVDTLGGGSAWRDLPRTWANPGFVVRYAHARAVAVQRWAVELGVGGDFRPELLEDRRDRAVLRLLAEIHGRRVSRDPGWAAYAEQLALAYHDAFEGAAALPSGDEEPSELHTARVRLARAVRDVLAEALTALGETAPERL
ncbi:DALR anticodon-binding domain-containing protein [Streptosporangium sp. NPDC000563]|uniref:DALR anticodon-binding domain-containing protein n=1 Tax=unclassified Streptosporangium TaxID=2632669 RepID=UPI0033331820